MNKRVIFRQGTTDRQNMKEAFPGVPASRAAAAVVVVVMPVPLSPPHLLITSAGFVLSPTAFLSPSLTVYSAYHYFHYCVLYVSPLIYQL